MKPNQESMGGEMRLQNCESQTRFSQLPWARHSQGQHYAPFMVKSKRFKQNEQREQMPAIGSYNLRSCFERKRSPFEDKMEQMILQADRKKQQMSVFKSCCERFDSQSREKLGPAYYNLFKNTQQKPHHQPQNLQREKPITSLTNKTCPSIPFKDNQYGYAFTDGKYQRIHKGLQQLQVEKQSRKQYVQTLKGEGHFKRPIQLPASTEVDLKKKLYETTEKIVNRENISPNSSERSSGYLTKKPKIQHLYHSKGVVTSESHKLLGPGQYDIVRKDVQASSKNEKFQFFGSSQIRFKHKATAESKGYSLIQMIKQNKKLQKLQKKGPLKQQLSREGQKKDENNVISPGPGQYNPKDELKKINKGNTLFPHSERFKQMYADKRQSQNTQQIDAINEIEIEKKVIRGGNLKKERFKPMQKTYVPIQSAQIVGILSDNRKVMNSIPNLSYMKSQESPEINSWSRDEKRNKLEKKGYIRQLKEQLEIISRPHQQANQGQAKDIVKLVNEAADKVQEKVE